MTERFRIEGLTKTHGYRRVLRGIDLTVGEGEIVGLAGSNGAGKSTLTSIASGLARANGGSMRLSGRPCRPSSGKEALAAGVSAVQRRFEAPEGMSVREFIGAGGRVVEGSLLAHGLAVLEQTVIRLDLEAPLSGLVRAEQALADVLRVQSEEPELVLVDEASTGDVVCSMFERRLAEPQRPGEAAGSERPWGLRGCRLRRASRT